MEKMNFNLQTTRNGGIKHYNIMTLNQLLDVISEAKFKNKCVGTVYLNINKNNPDDRYYSMQNWCNNSEYTSDMVSVYNKRTDSTRIIFDILSDLEMRNMSYELQNIKN